ncbi:MAG: ATP synthase F1 subunit gamma [Candidatus Omnitrophica bacterium]|nr:ATP synthase F1 subunit gamma [Candidatus Omnitrophota bacterium]
MANLKDLHSRIATLKNMQKVMRAMNMIASVKLRKLFRTHNALAFFEKSVAGLAIDIQQALKQSEYPLIAGYPKIKKAQVIIFTADKGLCGSHNSSVQKALDLFVQGQKKNNIAVEVTCIGLRGASFCKRRGYDIYDQTEINDRVFNSAAVRDLSMKISQRFLNNEIQEVQLIANYFVSTLQQDTLVSRLIPLSETAGDKTNQANSEFNPLIEPEPMKFIALAQEQYLYYKLIAALANSYLSEQSARMTAMENATKNSEDLINHYLKLQNRARQATITNDLIEIISGKEALKG